MHKYIDYPLLKEEGVINSFFRGKTVQVGRRGVVTWSGLSISIPTSIRGPPSPDRLGLLLPCRRCQRALPEAQSPRIIYLTGLFLLMFHILLIPIRFGGSLLTLNVVIYSGFVQ